MKSSVFEGKQVTMNMTVKYLNVLHHNRTQNICDNIAKILPTSYIGYFENDWPLPRERIIPTCRKFDVYLHVKNDLHF